MNERIDAFLRHLVTDRGLTGNTIAAYRNDLTQLADYLGSEALREAIPELPTAALTRERLGGYLLSLHDRGYAAATLARKVAALRTFCQFLFKQGDLPSDPSVGIGAPEVKKALPHAISGADVTRLFDRLSKIDSPEGQRDHAMLSLLYASGMRVGELVMLNVADVNLADARVRVTGRAGRERVLPLDAKACATLRAYIERARPYLVRHAPEETALVVNQRGQRLTRQGFWLIMKALVRDCGLPVEVTPHTLRHSFAAHQVLNGRALEELRQLMGHASIATTHVYTQLAPAHIPNGREQRGRAAATAGAR